MYTELLDIQPRDLKFIFELKKQSSCSVRLVNKSNHHVAYKIKTTSPKKYCVRPTTGIIEPKSTCDFTVTMQAHRLAPPDMICKDKFLVQSTVVPVGTTNDDITSSMFAKGVGKYVEDSKMRVILISPPHSPVLSPINGTLKPVPIYEASILKDDAPSTFESFILPKTVTENVEESKIENGEELKPAKDVEFNIMKDVEELKLVKDIEEMRSKLNELESKLSEAEVTIFKLTEERRFAAQETETLRKELALLRSKRGGRRVQVGFPLLFVCMVALVSITLGYLLTPMIRQ
uniref:Putative vesicle-associated protein 2-2 n=1 Tax=Davidia involucrata TaxID=16924 RepID=A0A5B6YKK0_DAVIN